MDDPIKENKTIFEKFRDRFVGGKRKKIFITTYSPYTKKEYDRVIGTYLSKDEDETIELFRKTIVKTGITAREALENIVKNYT